MADGSHSLAYAIVAPAVAAMARASSVLIRIAIVAALLVLIGGRAAAEEASQAGWVVVDLRGSAFSRPAAAADDQWRPLRPRDAVAPGSIVRTAEDGNLLLANRLDRIRLSPQSELELPRAEADDAVTRVVHWIGAAFFDVGRRPSPQFEVTTPYLVAVVKGTAFATTVSAAGSAVKVTEGAVGVTSAKGGASVEVTAGETASVSAGDGTVSPGDLSGASAPGQGTDESDPAARGGSQGQRGGNGNGGGREDGGGLRSARNAGGGAGGGPDDGGDGDDHDDDDGDDGDDDGDDGDDDGDDDDNDHDQDDDDDDRRGNRHGCHGGGCHHGGHDRARDRSGRR
jgi:hypothetical protein